MKRLRAFGGVGWLPVSQAASLATSLATFAILSRLIGPTSYAQFAVLAFAYTLCALATDLSAMGFLLVHGDTAAVRRTAWRSTRMSTIAGSSLLCLVLAGLCFAPLPQGPPGIEVAAILIAGLASQMLIQPLRGRLMVARRYGRIALADVTATIVGYGTAIVIALQTPSVTALCAQLALTSFLRLAVSAAMVRSVPALRTGNKLSGDVKLDLPNGIAYGLRVLPINVASYASRSIDSGVLPLILPASAAASYARSYQLIVTPITQVQLSLGGAIVERLARNRSGSKEQEKQFDKNLWIGLHLATFSAAIALSLLAPVIEKIFFGDGWTHVSLMISSMALLLPSLTLSSYLSWKLQIRADLRHSLRNLMVLLTVPLFAIVLGVGYSTIGAIAGLALGALIQSVTLALIHQRELPHRRRVLVPQVIIEWTILAALVALRL